MLLSLDKIYNVQTNNGIQLENAVRLRIVSLPQCIDKKLPPVRLIYERNGKGGKRDLREI